ncbi:lactate racemase domain-containing protein [uncultured Paracoccus sp.]|uniref:lactate racemase domain-containing protein n=1 Tax=uncultured Paracoccus sp. TaxID=189685 RepID=UPI002639D137|nr:lactate racemase domain-containing protein [uncultured Paracoccus sp.]
MGIIETLIGEVAIPVMTPVRQVFDDSRITDIPAAIRAEFARMAGAHGLRPGMSVAVGVGSRGLADLPLIVRATIETIRAEGAEPFIVPAMGSHGGASAEGQRALLAGLGVTPDSAGCEIRSSMEVNQIGSLPNGLPIYLDRLALQADGIVVINRVKPHTSFSAEIESGLAKMVTIGLGKQKGAESCHAMGFGLMGQNVRDMAALTLGTLPILFGIASVENAYDRVCHLELVPGAQIIAREPGLLQMARARMPRILFDPLDVLVVDRMGKEFSGTGMDPNITGRAGTPYVRTAQTVGKLAVLDLSTKSGGNATGIGLADICTRRLVEKIDYPATYANCITSTVLASARLPVIMECEKAAVQVALKTSNAADPEAPRMVWLTDTLHLETIRISSALLPEARENPAIEILGEAESPRFDAAGNRA